MQTTTLQLVPVGSLFEGFNWMFTGSLGGEKPYPEQIAAQARGDNNTDSDVYLACRKVFWSFKNICLKSKGH